MRLTFETVNLRTRHAFNIAREAGAAVRQTVWVRIEDDGVEGWGEAPATPFYGETADTVSAILPRLSEAMARAADGDVFALERIETALAHSIGRNPAAAPKSSFTIGIDSPEVMRRKVREAAEYDILKIKVGTPHDREVLQMIRDEAPEKTIRVDANTAWTAKEAIRRIPMLEEFGVEFVEQPLPPDDLEGLRLVRKRSRLPIIADESCRTAKDVAKLAGAVDGVNIKLAKCGSLREAIRIVHAARAHGMSVMIGCMVESTLGIAAAVPITPLVDYADLDGAALLADDPFLGPGIEGDGRMRFSDEPGLGVSRANEGRTGA